MCQTVNEDNVHRVYSHNGMLMRLCRWWNPGAVSFFFVPGLWGATCIYQGTDADDMRIAIALTTKWIVFNKSKFVEKKGE